MSDISEDAFKSESEIRVFGEDVVLESTTSTASFSDLPESKSNNVSFMKVEDLSRDCKNLLAVSDSCICYSVTQKKNLLRLIDTITGDKEILRGHEGSVTDIKFSSLDSTILATTDNAEVAGKPHTIVWKKNEIGIAFQSIAQLQLRGVMLIPHTQQSNLWAMSDGHNVGVFSSARVNMKSPASYAELSMSVHFDNEVVTDMAFSVNGRSLVVSLTSAEDSSAKTHVQVYRIMSNDSVLKGNESMTRVFDSLQQRPSGLGCIVSVQCVHDYLVTVSADGKIDSTDSMCIYTLRVWNNLQQEQSNLSVVQSLVIQLPQFKSRLASSTLRNPFLECSLQFELRNDKYLILSSRRSSIVACLAVAPTGSADDLLPLYHITYLNLKAPVVSMDVTTILGREHHSAEEGEHLEMSCYQEEASDQASIQQYHVLFRNLFDIEKSRATKSPPKPIDTKTLPFAVGSESKGKTILGLLNGSSSSQSNILSNLLSTPGVVSAPRLSIEEQAASFSTPSPSGPAAGLSAGLLSSAQQSASPLNSVSKPTAASKETLPAFLSLEPAAKNTSILNMIRTNSTSNVKADVVPKVSGLTPAATVPVVDKNAFPSPVPPKSDPAKPVVSADKQRETVEKKPEPVNKQNVTPVEEVAASAVSSMRTQKKAVSIQKAISEENSSETSSVSSLPLPPAPVSASSTPVHGHSSSLSASSIDLNGTPASMLGSLADIKQAVRLIAKSAVSKELLQSVKEEVLRETRAAQAKSADRAAAMEKMVESETKKAVEAALSTGKWKQELSASIAEALQTELAPLIAQKVKDSVKDTVRDTVKTALATSFRSAFDSSIVPAFQVGTDRMFGQVQTAFEQGMGGLVEEGRKAHQHSTRSTDSLESEIRGLKHTIHTLEAAVLELSERVSTMGSASLAQREEEEVRVDPFTLLEQGLISEALLRALEDKDVSTTISLLDRLAPSQVNSKCSNLVRLCITQQLAADMSVNVPEEGIAKRVEWIKNLVLSLVSAPASASSDQSDPTYERNFKSTIQMVLESLQAAKRLVFSNSEDSGSVPQSVGTDLQLLEFVIQSKL